MTDRSPRPRVGTDASRKPGADGAPSPLRSPRPRPALDRVLKTADRLFAANGIRATGVDAIAEDASVSKSTMYTYFRSKDDLVARSFENRVRVWQDLLSEQLLTSGRGPSEKILMVFDLLGEWLAMDPSNGRPFISSEAETGRTSPAHTVNVAHRAWVRSLFAELASAAGSRDPAERAIQLEMLYDGVLVGADIDPSIAWADEARIAAAQVMHTPTSSEESKP